MANDDLPRVVDVLIQPDAPGPAAPGNVGAHKIGLCGPAGTGKSVLAAAAARSSEVRERFADGIYWLHIGRAPRIPALQLALARAAGVAHADITTSGDGKNILEQHFRGKRVLLVLDSVVEFDHLSAFDVLGVTGALLFSTPNRGLIERTGAHAVLIDALDMQRSLALLATHAGCARESLGPDAEALAQACDHLPLALTAIAVATRSCGATFADALDWLRHSSPDNDGPEATRPHTGTHRALAAAMDHWRYDRDLGGVEPLDLYLDLAVLRQSASIPRATLHVLWSARGLDADAADGLIESLVRHHLLERVDNGHDGFLLHELCRGQLDGRAELRARQSGATLALAHARFVDAYAEQCAHDLSGGADDGYFFQHLAYHLTCADRGQELEALLYDYRWLDAQMAAAGIAHVLADFEFLPKLAFLRDFGQLRDALFDARHILAVDRAQLPSQLLGRLGHATIVDNHPRIRALLDQARAVDDHVWLCPIFPSLTPPGGPLMGTLTGHTSWVNAVAVTPDGTRAVSASEDYTVRVWDLGTGVTLYTLSGHESNINAVAVTPDNSRALSASSDRTIKVWELERGLVTQTLLGHSRGVDAIALTSDGSRLISGSRDQTLKVWDLASGRELRTLLGHNDYVHAVAVTPDGKYAVSGSRDHTIKIWDIDTGQEVRTLTGHTGWVNAVAVTPDNTRIVSASEDQTVRVWDLATGAPRGVLRGHTRWVDDVAVTPDGRRAVSASRDQTLKIWDLDACAELGTLTGHRRWVNAVALTPDGRRAISGSRDRTLKLWSLERGTGLRNLAGHAGWVNALAITPDGARVVSASTDKTLRVWDVGTGTELRAIVAHADGINAVALTPDGTRAVSASRDRTLAVWDLATSERLATMHGHTLGVVSVAVTPDGARAVSASSDKTVRVWDLESGRQERVLTGHDNWISAVALTPDGARVISASEDHSIKIWNLQTGAELHTLRGHTNGVVALSVTSDGTRLLSGSTDRTVRVWDIESGAELDVVTNDSRWINALVVTSDDAHLIEVSSKKYVELWHIREKRKLARFSSDSAMLGCAAHAMPGLPGSPDFPVVDRLPDYGDLVVVGDAAGNVHFLRLVGLRSVGLRSSGRASHKIDPTSS